jgi:4-hydroxybenzoate polyprenyltransferase
MHPTTGSQVFGSWYDIAHWFIASAIFIYFAFLIETLPQNKKEKIPKFFLKKRNLFMMASFMAMLGIINLIE